MTRYHEFTLIIKEDNSLEAHLKKALQTGYENYPVVKGLITSGTANRMIIDLFMSRLRIPGDELTPEELKVFGVALYEVLFPGEIGAIFEEALRDLHSSHQQGRKDLNLRLIIEAKPDSITYKYNWPLEFLRVEKWRGGKFIAVEREMISLSRKLVLVTQTIPESKKISVPNILLVVSKPADLDKVWAAPIVRNLAKMNADERWSSSPMHVKVLGRTQDIADQEEISRLKSIQGIEFIDQPSTFKNLQEIKDSSWSPHVVHFIGHGDFHRDRGGSLIGLVDLRNNVDWCSADDFASIFTVDWNPKLMILQACETAKDEAGLGFLSLAAHLVKQNIPAVVAMQFPIRNDYASDFAIGFYEALREGEDIDIAVQRGRWKISLTTRSKEKQFGAPVLFQFDPSGICAALSSSSPRPANVSVGQDQILATPSLSRTNEKNPDELKHSSYDRTSSQLLFALKKIISRDAKMADIALEQVIREVKETDSALAEDLQQARDIDDLTFKKAVINRKLQLLGDTKKGKSASQSVDKSKFSTGSFSSKHKQTGSGVFEKPDISSSATHEGIKNLGDEETLAPTNK